MTDEVAIVALLVILAVVLAAIVWRKDVKAGFNFLGLGSFFLEARDPKPPHTRRQRKTQKRSLPDSV
jgi:hypothetical protein